MVQDENFPNSIRNLWGHFGKGFYRIKVSCERRSKETTIGWMVPTSF